MGKIIRPRSGWDHPCCERCWINRSASVDEQGNTSIRKPVLTTNAEVERCHWCDLPTIIGLFVRYDPQKVPFPEPVEHMIVGRTTDQIQ